MVLRLLRAPKGVAVSVISTAVKAEGAAVPVIPIVGVKPTGVVVSVLPKVEVKLGIGVNVLVGMSVDVEEDSMDKVEVGVVVDPGEGNWFATGVAEERLTCTGLGITGRQAANIKPEARATHPVRATLFMPCLGRSDDLHKL